MDAEFQRTPDEILARIKELDPPGAGDFFGFQRSDLIEFLPFAVAKAANFLNEGTSEADWEGVRKEPTRGVLASEIKRYMPFAWEKANDCRGLSAARSINHMQAWLWLYGCDTDEVDNLGDYELYGKPQLRAICEAFGWPWRQWDHGGWVNSESDPNPRKPEDVPAIDFKLPE